MRRERGGACVLVLVGLLSAYGCGSSTTTPASTPAPTQIPTPSPTVTPAISGTLVYWDTNEEEDVLLPDGRITQMVAPYDPNGQMCILPDGTGRFVTGYNPTLPSQHNPGSLLPLMNPPVGEALWDADGTFSGMTIYVPGPYALPGQTLGGDIPPDEGSTFCTNGTTTGHCTSDADCPGGACSGTFNNNGTFTGCAIDPQGDLFAADIGQAQGSGTSPDQGRIIEWFPPDYTTYCIIAGPTQGGDTGTPHHVNGTGGLKNPGLMATDKDGNLYVPESGGARVIKFAAASLPHSAAECGSDNLLSPQPPRTTFIKGGGGIPSGIAYDPTCNCWAVSRIIGSPAVAWYDNTGQQISAKGTVPSGNYSPYGIAVAPNGDVFFVDIAISCDSSGNCGPKDGAGGIFKVSIVDGQPTTPQRVVGGLNFPVSVTTCDTSQRRCPEPKNTNAIPQGTPNPTPSGVG